MLFQAMEFPNIDPAALTLPGFELFGLALGPFPLRWYALAYIAGIVFAWRWMVWLIRREPLWAPGKPPLSTAHVDDFITWAMLGIIIGGRLGSVLFYSPNLIWENPLAILRMWEGGMSFHGGFIGVVLAILWFTRQQHVDEAQFAALAKKRAIAEVPDEKRRDYLRFQALGWVKKTDIAELSAKARTVKIDLLRFGDIVAAASPVGIFLVRIANFINGELWGRPTDAPWGVVFCNERIRETLGYCPAGEIARHPSQLYEAALEGGALFAIINIATLRFNSLRRPGLNVGLFLLGYGLFRFALEFVREPDAQMPEALRGYLTMGMILSAPMIAAGVWLIRRAFTAPKLA